MKDLLRERLEERALDARDWLDIRPDPHWWPAVAIPGMVALAYFAVPHSFLPFLLIGAVGLAVVFFVLFFISLLVSVLYRAVRDVYASYRAANPRRSQHGPIIIHRVARQ